MRTDKKKIWKELFSYDNMTIFYVGKSMPLEKSITMIYWNEIVQQCSFSNQPKFFHNSWIFYIKHLTQNYIAGEKKILHFTA